MNSHSASRDIRYSTEHVSVHHRFEYWNDVILRHCIPSDGKPLADGRFDGELAVREVGLVDVCTLTSTLHHWERKSRHLRTGPDDDLWLGYIQGGYGQLEQGGRKACLASNDLVLYDAAQTFRFSIGGKNNHLIRIPRHLLAGKVPASDALTATVFDDTRPGVIPLREMICQAANTPVLVNNSDVASRFSQTMLDLLILSLELQDHHNVASERDLYAKMRSYISRNLTNPELSVENIALAHHVSVRTVTRTFARHQKTPAAVIWQERLLASRDALEQGRVCSVSEAALDYGFSDFTHFSHAFRKAFGVTPSSLLRQKSRFFIQPG
ncbi:helix-turn-helix domain-containing protein [Raoultella sp. BAC10a-01-01]|uniref:Helix-turn-helix domain-containing protein n=1 Tax=Raoultella scottii TaxID=3040937 RepID=A0ABU8Z456_9ENTR